ncbi:MAG: DUF1015 domain-containing protein [Chloroflexi bacterium]|nr:DUF1015 domain-containing protein [Chloroflexota bacterium]
MPELRPFRALRYDVSSVGDLGDVVSPPYDVISPARQQSLARRHPRNVVRLDLPLDQAGDPPDERYRRAGRDLAAWRSEGTLRKDRLPAVYPYEQAYVVPGTGQPRVRRGFFARLRIEEFGPDSGVRPHERTLSAPKEDRYRLLRATGMNASPVVLLAEDPDGEAMRALDAVCRLDTVADVTDDAGVRNRLWQLATDEAETASLSSALLRAGSARPLTIADGHHRYETALRYRDERRREREYPEAEPFDYLLALIVPAAQPLTILPTHRIVRDGLSGDALLDAARSLFDVERLSGRDELLDAFSPQGPRPAEDHRIGTWTAGVGAVLHARSAAFEPLLDEDASPALRWLDVNLLAVALERLAGIGPRTAAGGGRIGYVKDAEQALGAVDRGEAGAAFLLDPTRLEDVLRIAAAGEVMPQKSTYFFPKQLTGLVLNPHEW